MGRKAAEKPQLLSVKLKNARLCLGFTQEQMYDALKNTGVDVHLGYVSLFETGQRIPSLLVLLAYSRISGVEMEVFVDDTLELTD
jgi:transcriptional regulator with XRE-family HTH domain